MMASGSNPIRGRVATAADDDVPLLVRVLAGNQVTGASVLSCLTTADTHALRRLYPAVSGTVAGVPWVDTATPVVDAVRWRAALPSAVSVRFAEGFRLSAAVVAVLAGVTTLDLSNCREVTVELLLHLPPSLRTLHVRWCKTLTARASLAHLTALVSLDCSERHGVTAHASLKYGLPPPRPPRPPEDPFARHTIVFHHTLPAARSLVLLSQLQVLRASETKLDDDTLASLPLGLVELDVRDCTNFTVAASFAHLGALQALHAAGARLHDATLATLPPSLVFLDVSWCSALTPAAALPHLPALPLLDVSHTSIGDALVASLPAGLEELRMVQCYTGCYTGWYRYRYSVTAGATLDHVRALRVLYSSGTSLAPAVPAAVRARGCVVPAVGEIGRHKSPVKALALLADGRLVSSDACNEMVVWDVGAGGDATAVLRTRCSVNAFAVLPGGRRLAVANWKFIEMWDLTATLPVQAASIPWSGTSGVSTLAVLADGRLAVGCNDGLVRFMDVDTGVVTAGLGVVPRYNCQVVQLAVLPDGTLVSGSEGGQVRVWDVDRQAPICEAELEGHAGSLAVLADGRLACGTAGGVVALWDVGTRTRLHALEGHRDQVSALVALPDGRLVSGDAGGTIHVWDTRPIAAAAVAASSCAASTVPMTVLAHMPWRIRTMVTLPGNRLACVCDHLSSIHVVTYASTC